MVPYGGGEYGGGVIFRINTDGSGYTVLHSFQDGNVYDGRQPEFSHLTLSGSTLYGNTEWGGGSSSSPDGFGTIFKINTDGSGYTILHRFHDGTVPDDGAFPHGSLTISGAILYGATPVGGSCGSGTIFKLNADGTNYTTLYSFGCGSDDYTNGSTLGSLTLVGSTLYGMSNQWGGGNGKGAIFNMNTDGTGFSVLHYFPDSAIANDGYFPSGGLTLFASALYGTTSCGGPPRSDTTYGYGTIFSLTLDPPVSPWTLYDDFNSNVIDPEKWVGSDNGSLLRERSMLISAKELKLLERSYGSLDSSSGTSAADLRLTFTNSPKIMGIKALVKPTAFEATGCSGNTACTSAEASLLGYFFNTDPQGSGSRKNDVFASIGVGRDSQSTNGVNKATVTARVGQCQDDACSTVYYLYSMPLGKLTKGSPRITSLSSSGIPRAWPSATIRPPTRTRPLRLTTINP